ATPPAAPVRPYGDAAQRSLRVHGLIQRATRDELSAEALDKAVRAAADAVLAAWPAAETAADHRVLRANADALDAHAGPRLWTTGAHPVLVRAAQSLWESGAVVASVGYTRRLYEAAAHHLGAAHPDTLAVRGDLALRQGRAGDWAKAAEETAGLLAERQRTLGPAHPETLLTQRDLASWLANGRD
ncbi:hypothetical protein ADK38_43060, partial [Streptomyces varsoviensis]